MQRKNLTAAVALGTILFVVGIILLLAAPNLGIAAADHAIQANGGSMDTEKYYFIMKSTALSCQIGGAICAFPGGLGAVLGRYPRGD